MISIIQKNVKDALYEDLNGLSPSEGDITANLIPGDHQAKATILTREACILAGCDWATEAFKQVDGEIQIKWTAKDGDELSPGQVFCELAGSAKSILTAERTALNFLQSLSATATVTHDYVSVLKGSNLKLLDTRKTLPGLRLAQKYAVTCGGGSNHRIGLFDAYLIKENHIMACGSIANAVSKARSTHADKQVEVEVESIDELKQAIAAGADIVMLDNFTNDQLREAVAVNEGKTRLEVSGNITKDRLTELRDIGVDYVSSGALTKHIQAIDLSLRIVSN
ncbi:carboxylating nicotinate-nucleotide diphosphorylase [Aestuariibacter sp. AA17]|uniref:nicotinate-nucleotide diphosphorylase (carboxylating) n=1 Tax=Fluctibacter corallii TaxID=2984329 RepID=A0ABT3A8A7_9ALTE|nr:carboxylating nicotinate-nucleotide diphosphorylase [Aestuariibacter sp. AA17]MCV2884920.1 carboxylating nicotinate-nucleotide diphosphorylase [Aestuariibacter sp. AA17]